MDEKNANQTPQPAGPEDAAQPTQPVADPAAQPAAEPTQPATPVAQPAADPAAQPVNPYIDAAAQPVQPVEPAAQPTQPVADPAAQSAQPANPYQQAYGVNGDPTQPVQPAQPAQPENPYGTPAPVAPPAQGAGSVPPYGQPPMGQPMPPYGQSQPMGTGKATAALVCGIAAILTCWIPLLSVILGIVAIVLAGSFIKAGGVAGTAKAGRICGIVGIVLALLLFVASMAFGCFAYNQIMDEIGEPTSSLSEVTPPPASSQATPQTNSQNSPDYPLDYPIDADERAACDVVAAQFKLMKQADPAVVAEIGSMADAGFTEATGFTMAECGLDPEEYARQMLEGFDYQVSGVVTSDDGTGFVAADVTVRDIFDVLDEFGSAVDSYTRSSEFEAASAQEAKNKLGALMLESIKTADFEEGAYLSLDIVNKNGTWVIDPDSWNFEIDYFFNVY